MARYPDTYSEDDAPTEAESKRVRMSISRLVTTTFSEGDLAGTGIIKIDIEGAEVWFDAEGAMQLRTIIDEALDSDEAGNPKR